MDGIILILKPPGMTSFDVVAWLRGIFRTKKIGHAGTLDPAATGLLPVCIGKATKTIDWFVDFDKAYRAEMVLGITTNTQDGEGQVTGKNPVNIGVNALQPALQSFIGEYEQIPPMYSAVKINGKRLYDLARQGVELERKSRKVFITGINLLEAKLQQEPPVARFDVACSKGTYIRTLCADIGEKLGCGAYMAFLVRTRVGPFSLENAITLEEIKKCSEAGLLSTLLLPVDIIFKNYPAVYIHENHQKRFINGAAIRAGEYKAGMDGDMLRVYSKASCFLGLGKLILENGEFSIQPHKLFI